MKTLPVQFRNSAIPIRLRKYRALPTWLIVQILRPMRNQDHPWYGKKIGLRDWYLGETILGRDFDFLLWVSGMGAIFAILWLVSD